VKAGCLDRNGHRNDRRSYVSARSISPVERSVKKNILIIIYLGRDGTG
jgi:hypothetical protein